MTIKDEIRELMVANCKFVDDCKKHCNLDDQRFCFDDSADALIAAGMTKTIGTMKLSGIEKMRLDAKQEGREEVAEWIKSHQLIEPDKDSITRFEPYYQIEQIELKEWEG